MRVKLLKLSNNLGEKLFLGFLYLAIAWTILAVIFGVFMSYLELTGKTEMTRDIGNWIEWRIDGTFKNSPENIWYNANDHIWVESVENKVKIGKLAGNRKLEFGVKNILENPIESSILFIMAVTGESLTKSCGHKVSCNILAESVASIVASPNSDKDHELT